MTQKMLRADDDAPRALTTAIPLCPNCNAQLYETVVRDDDGRLIHGYDCLYGKAVV